MYFVRPLTPKLLLKMPRNRVTSLTLFPCKDVQEQPNTLDRAGKRSTLHNRASSRKERVLALESNRQEYIAAVVDAQTKHMLETTNH